jgi:hypothetical protein
MPEKEVVERARRKARQGRSPSTQAGEFVREEIHHVREGKHGARSARQAIAIGLSKARRAGVEAASPAQRKSGPCQHPPSLAAPFASRGKSASPRASLERVAWRAREASPP